VLLASCRSVWIFLAGRLFSAKTRLSAIGFPWILSSETRFINELYDINRQKFFVSLFVRAGDASMAAYTFDNSNKQDRSSASLP
jgi:hypothetical protein